MKQKILFIVLIGVCVVFGQKTTLNGGELTGNIRWSGTIHIRGDVTVAATGRLTIDAGAKIIFEPNSDASQSGEDPTRCELIVRGILVASGQSGNKIVFTSAALSPRMADWCGIQFMHVKSESIIDYCVVEYAYNGIRIKNSQVQVSNSEIRYNFHSGILTEIKSRPKIARNIISENDYAGVVCALASAPYLSDNLITLNRIGLVAFSLAQPNLGSSAKETANPGRNRILENEEYNIYNHSNMPIPAENNAWGNLDKAGIDSKNYDRKDNDKYGSIDFEPLYNQSTEDANLEEFLLLAQNTQTGNNPESTLPRNITTARQTNQPVSVPREILNTPDGNTQQSVLQSQTQKKTNPDTILKIDQFAAMSNTTPLLAQAKPEENTSTELAVSNEEVVNRINYDEVILEPFLDGGKKQYFRREPIKMNEIIRQSMQSGEIRIKVVVRKDGIVESATVLKGLNRVLDTAAQEAVQEFRYKPGLLNGHPVRFSTMEVFLFK